MEAHTPPASPSSPIIPNPRHRALSPQLPQQLQGFLPLPCRRAADHHATQGLVAGHVASLLHLLKSSARRNPSQSFQECLCFFFRPGVQRFCPILIPCFAEHEWDMESSTITSTPRCWSLEGTICYCCNLSPFGLLPPNESTWIFWSGRVIVACPGGLSCPSSSICKASCQEDAQLAVSKGAKTRGWGSSLSWKSHEN